MNEKKLEGLFSSPFFVPLKNIDGFNKDKLKEKVEIIFEREFDSNRQNNYYYGLLCKKILKNSDIYEEREKILSLAKEVVIKAFVDEELIDYILPTDECKKIRDLISKKQFNSKMIQSFASQLSEFLYELDPHCVVLGNMFILELSKKIKEYKDEVILKRHTNLKDTVDKITSGVSRNCYFNIEYDGNYSRLNEEIDNYIITKHKYFTNNYEGAILYRKNDYEVMQSYLCGENDRIDFVNFLNNVYEFNDLKHVEKIIDFCFNEFCKTEKGKFIYDNKLPLDYIYNIEDKIIDFSKDWLNSRILKISNQEISKEDAKGLIYPIYNVHENAIEMGYKIFNKFLDSAYKEDASKVKNIFKNTDNIIQDSNGNKRKLSLGIMLDAHIVGYWDKSLEKKYLYNYYKDFGSSENILKRFYYVIYLINKYIQDAVNESIYEYMYDILNMINVKFDITCKYTVNHKMRETNYLKLKEILSSYNLDIDDIYKEKYIIALLDRKYATANESVYFPELEMLGDAIYDMALSEILFYSEKPYDLKKDYLVSANAQIDVSKKIGLDKLYISNLISDLTSKYGDYDRMELGLNWSKKNNYIADSLEMIIGVIYQEFGLTKALDFTTRIILETYTNLNSPMKLNFDDAIKSNIDDKYLQKIFPCLFSSKMDENFDSYSFIWYSLTKLLKTISIGTDSIEKRKYITNNIWSNHEIFGISNNQYNFSRVLGYYLYNGIEKTYEFFDSIIKDYYNNLKK